MLEKLIRDISFVIHSCKLVFAYVWWEMEHFTDLIYAEIVPDVIMQLQIGTRLFYLLIQIILQVGQAQDFF